VNWNDPDEVRAERYRLLRDEEETYCDLYGHRWGVIENSRFTGAAFRRCLNDNCDIINALDDDDPHEFEPQETDDEFCICGYQKDHAIHQEEEEIDQEDMIAQHHGLDNYYGVSNRDFL